MQMLSKIGVGIMLAGFFLVMAGGVQVRSGPDGTWIQVTLVHALGGGLIFCGMVLAFIAAYSQKPRS